MRVDNERDVVLHARHAAQRIKSELEYTLSRVLDNVESVRSTGGLPLLNELRGFRHVFRHAYSYGMDIERVRSLLRKILRSKNNVIQDFKKFRKIIAGYIEP